MRSLIGALRLLTFLLTAGITIIVQTVALSLTKGRAAYLYPRAYHGFLCRLFGIKIIVEGKPATGPDAVYIGNHLSYLDIPVLGSLLLGSFVAKKEVESWPFFGLMAKMQRTVFISRNPADAESETRLLHERLAEAAPLIIFPEGTSSDGTSVLPFKSSFFQIFLNQRTELQPFTISILEIDGKPATAPALRDKYAWYGDMELEPHLWAFAKGKGAVVKVSFETPLLSTDYTDRKRLCADSRALVVKGLDLSPPAS
ncbi:MAG: lysophospholipid acyltransferase family protein [Micavibrio sp.]